MSRGANPADLMVPTGYIPPRSMEPLLSAGAAGMKGAGSLVDAFQRGRNYRPRDPIMLVGPDGSTPIILITEGDVEISELQDMALEAIGHQEELAAKGQRGMDFDKLREKHGAVRHEDAPMAIRDAIAARIAHHKQNPVTDPFRQPRHAPRPPQFALGSFEKEAAS